LEAARLSRNGECCDTRSTREWEAIEPVIGHLKSDHRMGRCHSKGMLADKMHAVLCAAGYNVRWLARMIAKNGVRDSSRARRALAAIAVRREERLGLQLNVDRMQLLHHHETGLRAPAPSPRDEMGFQGQ
jgi:hypothetical protein